MRTSQISFLETVFPPFTNRNVKTLTDKANQNVAEILKKSNFYMIGARAKASFANWKKIENSAKIMIDIQIGDDVVDSGIIDVSKFEAIQSLENPIITITEDAILIGTTRKGTHAKVWLTPDSIYWKLSRGDTSLAGFDNHRTVCNYELLYVGIATKQDSYTRLLKKGHHVRQRILGEEPQRKAGAHVTDEIILFLFDIEPISIRSIGADDPEDAEFMFSVEQNRVISDAEKAFIKLLDPSYNTQKFANYPQGVDGLYDQGLDAYAYVLNENFVFNTKNAIFRGKHSDGGLDNHQDSIHVEGNNVELFISGVDFPEGSDIPIRTR